MSFSDLKSLGSLPGIASATTGVSASVGIGSFLTCGYCCATETKVDVGPRVFDVLWALFEPDGELVGKDETPD